MGGATMKYTAESGHWYTRDGEPAYTYLNRDGVEKNTTLRQARERNLVPSVTTILNIADKPGLNHWKALQTIQATTQAPNTPITQTPSPSTQERS